MRYDACTDTHDTLDKDPRPPTRDTKKPSKCTTITTTPWAQGADDVLTMHYARWSRAAESYITSTMPSVVGDESYLGRGSVIKFKLAPNSLATRKDHIFASPQMSYWDKFSNMLKRLKAHLKNGNETMVMQLSAEITEKLEGGAKEVFPSSSTFSLEKFSPKIRRHCMPQPSPELLRQFMRPMRS